MEVPGKRINPGDISKALMEAESETERKLAYEYQKKIVGMVGKIRTLMVEDGFRVKDWYAVVEYMDNLQSGLVSRITFKELYDRKDTSSTSDTNSKSPEEIKRDDGGRTGEGKGKKS